MRSSLLGFVALIFPAALLSGELDGQTVRHDPVEVDVRHILDLNGSPLFHLGNCISSLPAMR